jgi:non-ribosomal peptide synthetase component F
VTTRFNPDLDAADQTAAPSNLTHAVAVYAGNPAAAPRTLWDILEATAEEFPEAIAMDDGGTVLNYLDLLAEARRAGDRLAAIGIGAGDRVGIRATSGRAELYLSILAVLSVGAAYVPVDVDDPGERAELVWSAAGVCAILGDGGELTRRGAGGGGGGGRPPPPPALIDIRA